MHVRKRTQISRSNYGLASCLHSCTALNAAGHPDCGRSSDMKTDVSLRARGSLGLWGFSPGPLQGPQASQSAVHRGGAEGAGCRQRTQAAPGSGLLARFKDVVQPGASPRQVLSSSIRTLGSPCEGSLRSGERVDVPFGPAACRTGREAAGLVRQRANKEQNKAKCWKERKSRGGAPRGRGASFHTVVPEGLSEEVTFARASHVTG